MLDIKTLQEKNQTAPLTELSLKADTRKLKAISDLGIKPQALLDEAINEVYERIMRDLSLRTIIGTKQNISEKISKEPIRGQYSDIQGLKGLPGKILKALHGNEPMNVKAISKAIGEENTTKVHQCLCKLANSGKISITKPPLGKKLYGIAREDNNELSAILPKNKISHMG